MSKSTITHAPYSANGSLLPFADTWMFHSGQAEMREIVPFDAVLVLNGMHRGQSSALLYWMTDDVRQFPMFLTDVCALMSSSVITHGRTGMCTWTVRKRGQNYGLKFVKNCDNK